MDLSNIVNFLRLHFTAAALLVGVQFVASLFAPSLPAEGLPVKLTTSVGDTENGDLVAVTETGIEFVRAGETVQIEASELMSMEMKSVEKRSASAIQVLLVGGAQLSVDEVHTDGDQIVIGARRQAGLRLPLKQVKAIRFRKPSAATDAVWLGMLETPSHGDRMVIRRSSDRLDPTDGIVEGIADQKVQFDLDGDSIAAPMDRLEGVIFGGTDRDSEMPGVLVTDVYGSTWAAKSLLPSRLDRPSADQGIRVSLLGDISHTIPIDLVRSVRWSSGLFMLADAKPAALNVQPEFGIRWKEGAVDKWFGPAAVDATKQSSGSQNQDLVLYGGTEAQYRVEKGFRLFSGSVRRGDEIKNASGVRVRISLDEEVVWENDLPDADSLGFELELGSARRIKMEVDSGNDGDLGTIVHMIRPRLVK